MKRFIVLTALAMILTALCAGPAWAWTFAQITDLHVSKTDGKDVGGQNFKLVSENIVALTEKPKFVLVSGDLVNNATDDNYTELVNRMAYYNNTWYLKKPDGTRSDVPVYFTPGNHDTRSSNWWLGLGSLGFYDSKIQYEATKPKPKQPGSTTDCVFGSGVGSHDYYFFYGNALIVSMYAGKDKLTDFIGSASYPESAGLENDQITWLRGVLSSNSGKKPKIIFIHNPIATSETDWGDGCIYQNRVGFAGACSDYTVDKVLVGHIESDDRRTLVTGTEQVRTGPGYGGNYRIFSVDASTNVTVGNTQSCTAIWPTAWIDCPTEGANIVAGRTYTIKCEVRYVAPNLIKFVDFYVDGAWIGRKVRETSWDGQKVYTYDYPVPSNKAVNMNVSVKVYTSDTPEKTNTAQVTVVKGASSYYGRLNVGSSTPAPITDPLTGVAKTCQLVQIVSSGTRYASVSVGGDVRAVNAGEMQKVPGTGLFVYVATVFDGTERFAEIMIAPYQYPSVDIITPEAGQTTGICVVRVVPNYSGKNVPWNGIGNPPVNADLLKTLSFNNSAGQTDETFVWTPPASGQQTMTVRMTDKLGATVSKSVTVNYDASIPFYVCNGPYGDDCKTSSLSITNHENRVKVVHYVYCSPPQDKFGGDAIELSKQDVMDRINIDNMNATAYKVPSGGVGVWVVDRNQYLNDSFPAARHGYIRYRDLYDRLAGQLGKDNQGKWRVWTSSNPSRTDAAPLTCLNLPAPAAPTYSNIMKNQVTINWANLYGELGYQVQKYNGSAWGNLGSQLGADVTSYTDNTVAAGQTYSYRIIAKGVPPCSDATGQSSSVTAINSDGLTNGNFEGTGGWANNYGPHYNEWHYGKFNFNPSATDGPYQGQYYGSVYHTSGFPFSSRESTIQTQFIVPSDAVTLSYALKITDWTSAEIIVKLNGSTIKTYPYQATSRTQPWTVENFNITAYRGQSATLQFICYAEVSLVFGIDAVFITGTLPTVSVTAPVNGSSVSTDVATSITASASDSYGSINRVEFYVDGTAIGEDFTSPYTCDWTPRIAKSYTLMAKAFDMSGSTNTATVTVTATGIVGHWKLDAVMGTIATDNSGNDNQGTLVNGPTWVAGKVGNALSFDGANDYVNTTWSGTLSKWSITAWIRDDGTQTDYRAIVQTQDPNAGQSDHGLYIYPSAAGSKLGFWPYGAGTVGITSNVWTHVTATYDGSTVRYYVNGAAAGLVSASAGDAFKIIRIGAWGTGDSERFSGLLDEVRIYNRALSAAEVAALCGPAGHWKLDEAPGATTAFDASGNGNTGTLVNGPTWVAGQVGTGNALSFNGSNQYVSVPHSASLNITQAVTMSAWVKTSGTNDYSGIIKKYTTGNAGCQMSFNTNGGVRADFGNGSTYITPTYTATNVENGVWHLIVATYDGTTAKIYVDGVAGTNASGTGYLVANTNALLIGVDNCCSGRYFNGVIDDARIYNRALSLAEVLYMYNNPGKTGQADVLAGSHEPALPAATQLLRCAPNPFNGQTTINFQLAKPSQATIAVYNVTGQKVKALINECLRPGYHSVKWDGKDANGNKVAAGVYLYRMSAGDYSATKKMTVIR